MKKSILFFDLGEVLVANYINPFSRIEQTLLGRGYAKTIVDQVIQVAEVTWRALPSTSGWIGTWEQEEKVMMNYYATVTQAIPDGSAEMAAELFWLCHYIHHAELYPDVLNGLRELQTDYRLAVISNALPSNHWVIDRLNIRQYFESITLSSQAGYAKPDERIYRVALDAMKGNPEECIFVDDQLANVEAAQKLGMRGFHLDRDENKGEIHNLTELMRELKI